MGRRLPDGSRENDDLIKGAAGLLAMAVVMYLSIRYGG